MQINWRVSSDRCLLVFRIPISVKKVSIFKMYVMSKIAFLTIFVFLIASVSAAPQFPARRPFTDESPTPYQYQYNVDNPPTNTFFGKNEVGDAAGRVSGSYYVYLPDGRLMTVDYTVVGDSGFVPKIVLSNPPNTYRGPFQG